MAFNAIAGPSAACSSSSKRPCYDVFINHRGKDVKHKLASTLYNMFDLMGVKAFLDEEELELGDSFPQAIEDAMRSASVHVAIFSPSYAESPWCLEELWLMLQIKVTIIPVFYHVLPSDLRHVENEKAIFAGAFYRHRHKGRYKLERIQNWKEALGVASNLTGCILAGDNCDEGKLLREIVDAVLNKMKKVPLEVATFPVGLDKAVQDFESTVGSSIGSQNAHIVGIVGMGGSGKTTLAKELYNKNCSFMSRSSFLSNVRDAASRNKLHKVQKKLLKHLRIKHPKFDNKYEGIRILARDFTSMAALIVLDDVDHVDQMRALIPPNIGRGSFIIVTTRDRKVLTSWGISSIYPMKQLDPFNSKQLFCRHAFLHPYSQLGFEHLAPDSHNVQHLIERFVKACNGLPLSLKVLGAMVNGQSEAYWEDQLQKLSRLLPEEIVNCLKLSYDALDSEVQQMFLDVACFFIGQEKSLVVQIWDGSGWSGELGWETLVNKCLVGLDEYDEIEMHDHLRDMGREIARDASPSRIWKKEQISIQEGRPPIRGIVAAWQRWESLEFGIDYQLEHYMENFIERSPLRALKLLSVRGNDFREEFAASRDLVWLRLLDFDGVNLPSWLSLANLRVLELYGHTNLEELWQDNVQPPLQLRELIIKIAMEPGLGGLPRSIGRLRYLTKIVLTGCYSAILPEEFCHLESLEYLELWHFPNLSSLPDDFGKLINLRSLRFVEVELTTLPHSFKQLTALQSLYIEDSSRFMFTSNMLDVLEFMTQLQVLSFRSCTQLEESPHLTTQISLRELSLDRTGLRELPNNIGQLTKLETLDIGCLSNVQSLEIRPAPVVELGLGIGSSLGYNLNSLKTLRLLRTEVCKISILDDCCPILDFLVLSENKNLTEIETLPRKVGLISVVNCKALKSMRGMGGLLNLGWLDVRNCPDLEVVPCPPYMFSPGHRISIKDCPKVGTIDVGKDNSY